MKWSVEKAQASCVKMRLQNTARGGIVQSATLMRFEQATGLSEKQ